MPMLISIPKNTVEGLASEIIVSIFIMAVMSILAIIIGVKARKADPLKRPKGILQLAEMGVEKMDAYTVDAMGKRFLKLSPYFGALAIYIFVSFIIGLIGLPSPITNLMVPLSLAIITFLMIHITSIYYTRWKYFKRYIDPVFLFLPINLISMWAPIISLTFRMFGNALAGSILMTLVYAALNGLSNLIFGNPYIVAPLIAPALHAYFDIFTAYIQTMVFVTLTMLFVSQEGPDDEEAPSPKQKRRSKRRIAETQLETTENKV